MGAATRDNGHRSSARRDAMITGSTQLLAVVAALGMTVVAARMLSVTEFAVLSWVLSWVLLLGVIAGFGTAQSSVVSGARYGIGRRRGVPTGISQNCRPGIGGSPLDLALPRWPYSGRATDSIFDYRGAIIAVGIWIPTAGLSGAIGGMLRGLGPIGKAAPDFRDPATDDCDCIDPVVADSLLRGRYRSDSFVCIVVRTSCGDRDGLLVSGGE